MVHYDGASETTPTPLNLRSGNRRNEFGTRSQGGNIVVMRSHSRSERSEVGLKNGAAAVDVAAEVDAMGQVARALAALPDAQSRARVLRWAMDRYHLDVTPTAAPAVPATIPAPAVPVTMAAAVPEIAAPDAPATMEITGADSGLEVDSLHDLFPARPGPDIDEEALSIGEPARPAQESGIESMVRSFAADFRRFALEWQGT